MDRNNRDSFAENEERPDYLPTRSIETSFKSTRHRKGRTSWIGTLVIVTVVIVIGVSICQPNYMKIDPGRQALNDTPYAVVLNSGADAKSTNIDDSYYDSLQTPSSNFGNTDTHSTGSSGSMQSTGQTTSRIKEANLDWMASVQAAELQAMMVYRAQVSIKVDEVTKSTKAVTSMITKKGGYISAMNQTGKEESLSVKLDIQIPSNKLFPFLDELDTIGNIEYKNAEGEDVGSEYFDLQARKKSLQLSYQRLSELMGKTGKLSDLLTVEQEVRRTEEELNQVNGRIKQLEHWTAYSTVELVLSVDPPPDVFEQPKFSWMTNTAFGSYWMKFLFVARGLWHMVLFIAAFSPLIIGLAALIFFARFLRLHFSKFDNAES